MKSFLENLEKMGCFEEHPSFDDWHDMCLDEIEEALSAGFVRHGDSWYDGVEGLMQQIRRKLGDMQTLVFDTDWEQAKLGFGDERADGVVAVSRDLAVFAFLQYMFVRINELLESRPDLIDAAQVIRVRRERQILKKYKNCLRGEHSWVAVAETLEGEIIAQECSKCGLQEDEGAQPRKEE